MRTEELQNEAKLYNGDNECYVHVEKTQNQNMRMITCGDPAVLMSAAFLLNVEISKYAEVDTLQFLKKQIKMYKKLKPEPL